MTHIPQSCVLAGDIGGTKTRLAIIDMNGSRLHTQAEKTYPSLSVAESHRRSSTGSGKAILSMRFSTTGECDRCWSKYRCVLF